MSASPPALELVDPVADTQLKMDVGARFVVRLAENPTTGFRWHHTLTVQGVIEWVEDEYVSYGNLPGSPGRRSITFRALHSGSAAVEFQLRRGWETKPPLKSLRILADVAGPESAAP
jgi:predicted secreted protein